MPNIIQRRELEPLLLKAGIIAKHYEKAANCPVSVMRPESAKFSTASNQFNFICRQCAVNNEKDCESLHTDAINKARHLGGSYIYTCTYGLIFWTSPFYSGERFAGAFLSGGIPDSKKNSDMVNALANMMLICANQITGTSLGKKNIISKFIKAESVSTFAEGGANRKNNQKIQNNAYSMEMERMLFANLRRGDNTEAKKVLLDLLNIHYQEVKSNFRIFRLKAMELAVLLSRAASDLNDINNNAVFEITNNYINKIEESSNFHEIAEILSSFTEKMEGKIFSFHGVRHFPVLRRAERFIWENYTRKISLKEIANVSGLSAAYFSTIFKKEMGENLSNYLNRLRVEKAAAMLVTTDLPISEITKTCGFEDQSWFSKIFKNNTGLTPGKYREQGSISGLSA
jgi:AraC-like DNA-binding protein/ligand-binding sensor protein